MLDKATVREIARDYSDEVRKIIDPVKIILFGSYITGTPNEWSDIDIAVLVNGFEGNWLDANAKLFGLKWEDRFLDIEPHLLDETQDPSGFVEYIIKTGEVIYQTI